MSDRIELKPCPFCGANARLVRTKVRHTDTGAVAYYVRCTGCQATQWPDPHDGYPRYGSEAAARAWNRRAQQ